MFCSNCGKEISERAAICVNCGCAVEGQKVNRPSQSGSKNWTLTLLLARWLGIFGAHRFYTGYIGLGVAQLLTFGGCGIWTLIDLICIQFNKYEDESGKPLDGYYHTAGMFDFGMVLLCIVLYLILIYIYFFVFLAVVAAAANPDLY